MFLGKTVISVHFINTSFDGTILPLLFRLAVIYFERLSTHEKGCRVEILCGKQPKAQPIPVAPLVVFRIGRNISPEMAVVERVG
jgi:hypothetical protein